MIRHRISIALYDAKCRLLKWQRIWQNWGKDVPATRRFLFVLCPTYAGSTLMQELLSTSPQISPNNVFGTREGLGLPEVRRHFDYRHLWDEDYQMPWLLIRKEWEAYWQNDRPLWLEKSPSNLLHAPALAQNFDPASFIIMVRNPYAHCESLLRRDGQSPKAAARFCLDCLQRQRENLEQLPHSLLLRYEDLVEDLDGSMEVLHQFLPQIQKLSGHKKFKAHNYRAQKLPITNLNQEKIARLTSDQIWEINQVLTTDLDILSYFRYSLHPSNRT